MSFHSAHGANRSISSSTWAVAYSAYSGVFGTAAISDARSVIGGGWNVQSSPPE